MEYILYGMLAVVILAGVFWYRWQEQKQPTDKQLKDWLATVEVDGLLTEAEYTAVDKLFPPRLKAKYLAAYRKQRNQYTARTISIELIQRLRNAGKPVTDRQLDILRKEGVEGFPAESKTPVPTNEEIENGAEQNVSA